MFSPLLAAILSPIAKAELALTIGNLKDKLHGKW